MKILHILPPGGTSWGAGIAATLNSLASSSRLEWVSFKQVPLEEALGVIQSWQPKLFIWHPASSWRLLPTLVQLSHFSGCRSICVEHHYSAGFEKYQVPALFRFRSMLRLSYGSVDRLVCVSQGQAQWVVNSRLAPKKKVVAIPFSRKLDEFLTLPPPSEGHEPFRIGAYGRFVRQKGFETLIDAVKALPIGVVDLRLGGNGDLADVLQQQANNHPAIRFVGPVQDVPSFLADCDAAVVPSRWEPWGNVCLEIRASARPLIVTAVDGLPEQMCDCGLLVPADDAGSLSDAIRKLISSSASERRRMAMNGRRSATTAWEDFVAAWDTLLRQMTAED
jgi:glycosyltransferase involved in cell wall biosynthesis